MNRRRVIPAAVVALAVGMVAGLGAGGALAGHDGTAARGAGGAGGLTQDGANTFLHARGATATTATVPTQPTVTSVQTQTTDTTTLPGYGRPTVTVGDMNTPEQFVIGALYVLALQQQGYTVALNRNIGPSKISQAALRQGSLSIYPTYLATWNSQVAGLHQRFPTAAASYAAADAYARRHGMVLLPPTPFSDTGAIAMLSQYAKANHITSVADLAKGTGVILAAPLEFQNAKHGLPAFERAYGLKFSALQSVDIGFQYSWLRDANAQAAYVNTTDPELSGPQFRLLADPKHFFGFGNVVPVTTERVLKAEGPAFSRAIEAVDRLLTTSAMRGLNAEVSPSFGNHNNISVASEFLQGNGVLPPVQFAPVTTGTTTSATGTVTTGTSSTRATTTGTSSTGRTTTTGTRGRAGRAH